MVQTNAEKNQKMLGFSVSANALYVAGKSLRWCCFSPAVMLCDGHSSVTLPTLSDCKPDFVGFVGLLLSNPD